MKTERYGTRFDHDRDALVPGRGTSDGHGWGIFWPSERSLFIYSHYGNGAECGRGRVDGRGAGHPTRVPRGHFRVKNVVHRINVKCVYVIVNSHARVKIEFGCGRSHFFNLATSASLTEDGVTCLACLDT